MLEPKYVIVMGACTITWGMFSIYSYSTVHGVDKLIHVDIYLPIVHQNQKLLWMLQQNFVKK
jgi:NADH:ubiquinone oxidoreductase subunit B-like Fe-S oxidoreductase